MALAGGIGLVCQTEVLGIDEQCVRSLGSYGIQDFGNQIAGNLEMRRKLVVGEC